MAGGKLKVLKGDSVDEMSLYETAELLMQVIHDAATGKVAPKGDIPTSERPESIPKALAEVMPEGDAQETATELGGMGGALKNYSELAGLGGTAIDETGKTNSQTESTNIEEATGHINSITGNRETMAEDSKQATGTINNDKEVELPDKEEIDISSKEDSKNSGTFSPEEHYDTSNEKLETKDFGVRGYIYDEEVRGTKVNIHVYARIDDSMLNKKQVVIPLDIVARHGNSLYTINFRNVEVRVGLGNFDGETWYFIEILQSITAEGKIGRASLNAGKIYKIRSHGKD